MIFPGEKDPSRFYIRYKKLVLAAGLTYERGKTGPQKIRRSFASYIAAEGGDPTAALRHSDTRVTIESYIDPTIACPEPPNTLLFDLESGTKKKRKVKKPK